jgi:hypothetical protein
MSLEEKEQQAETEAVDDIKDVLNESSDTTDEKSVEEATTLEETSDIPTYLREAGIAAGLDEATVKDLAENDMDRLKDLGMAYLSSKFRADGPKKDEPVAEEEEIPQPEALGHITAEIPANADTATKQLIQALVEHTNKLTDVLNGDRQKVHALERNATKQGVQNRVEFDAQVDGFFDKKMNDVPALGSTRTLTPQQQAARSEIYAISRVFKTGVLEDRLDKAVKAYEGIHNTAEQNLRRKLDKQKTKFSPRPSGQKADRVVKTGDAEAYQAMLDAAAKSGIRFNVD